MDPKPVPPHPTAQWPDIRLLLKGLRARAGTPRPARDPRDPRSRGDAR